MRPILSSSLQSAHLATSLRAPDEFEAVVHEIQALEGRLGSTSEACEEGPGLFAHFLKILSVAAVLATLPFSLFFAVKVVQVQKILLKRSDHVYCSSCCRSTREQSSSGWVAW